MKGILTSLLIIGLNSISFAQNETEFCGLYNSTNKVESDSTRFNGIHINDLKNIKISCESLDANKKYKIETVFTKGSRVINKSLQVCKMADYRVYNDRVGVATRMLVEIKADELTIFNIKLLRD